MLYYLYVNRTTHLPVACSASSRLGLSDLRAHAEKTLDTWVITHGRLGTEGCEVIEEKTKEKTS